MKFIRQLFKEFLSILFIACLDALQWWKSKSLIDIYVYIYWRWIQEFVLYLRTISTKSRYHLKIFMSDFEHLCSVSKIYQISRATNHGKSDNTFTSNQFSQNILKTSKPEILNFINLSNRQAWKQYPYQWRIFLHNQIRVKS